MKHDGWLLLVFGVSLTRSELIDLNRFVDENIYKVEELVLEYQPREGLIMPAMTNLNDNYSFPSATVMGLDRLRRTGKCQLIKNGRNSTYELNIGSRFLVIILPRLRYKGEDMSAILRIRDNSMYLSFDKIRYSDSLEVILKKWEIRKLEKVEFWSSSEDYDGEDVEDVLETIRRSFNDDFPKERGIFMLSLWKDLNRKGIFNEL